jgi:hypothetical protein
VHDPAKLAGRLVAGHAFLAQHQKPMVERLAMAPSVAGKITPVGAVLDDPTAAAATAFDVQERKAPGLLGFLYAVLRNGPGVFQERCE